MSKQKEPYVHPMDMDDEQYSNWLTRIRRGIGGYDIQTLMGEGGGTLFDLYAKFLDMGDPIKVTAPMKRGSALEDDALELFAKNTGLTVVPMVGDDMFVRHPENKFLVAQIDGKVIADGTIISTEQGDGLVDAKVPSNFFYQDYVADGIPTGNYLQLQWQMGLTGIKWGTFAILDYENWRTLGGDNPPMIEADPELFAAMREKAEAFLTNFIFTRTAPEEDAEPDKVKLEIPVIGNEESRVSDPTHMAMLLQYFKVREERKLAALHEKKLKEGIEGLFSGYDTSTLALSGPGERRKIHWRPGTRKSFKQKEAIAALRRHGEDESDFYTTAPTRPFKPIGD